MRGMSHDLKYTAGSLGSKPSDELTLPGVIGSSLGLREVDSNHSPGRAIARLRFDCGRNGNRKGVDRPGDS